MKKESSGYYLIRIVMRIISLIIGLLFLVLAIFRQDLTFSGFFGIIIIISIIAIYFNIQDFITQLKWEIKEELQDHGN